MPLHFGLIGDPIEHSLSPLIHNTSFCALGIDATYSLLEVPDHDVPSAIRSFKNLGIAGINVTMPYKRAVLPALHELTPTAELAQSVNTVAFRDNQIIGHSTDGLGMIKPLRDAGIDLSHEHILILGSGGAGTSVALAAAQSGARRVTLMNREGAGLERAHRLAARIRELPDESCTIGVVPLATTVETERCARDATVILNCTSAGMNPNPHATPVLAEWLSNRHVVMDAVYTPRVTQFLRDASVAGARTFDGLSMLVAQAALAEEFWLECTMPTEYVIEELGKSAQFSL